MNEHETNGVSPRLRLLGLVPLDFQAPAVQRTDTPLAVGSGDAPWFRANLPCVAACPLATDVPRYVALVAQGQFRQAAAVVEAANLFPEILSLVCPRPCEPACRRGLIDAPVAIRQLKRAAVEFGQRPTGDVEPAGPPTGRRVAIVGSGPAGMAAARTLRGWGHAVTAYEAEALGGTLTSAIPAFRLPPDVIAAQWQRLQDAGVEVRVPVRVGADVPLEVLLADYDAVLLAAGCQQPVRLPLPGADLPGVYTGLDSMKDLGRGAAPPLGERVVVIGAGLVGLDCARSAVRLGAQSVIIIELLPEHRLPYDPDERTVARDEGITFVFERRVTQITGHETVAGVETEAYHGAGDGETGGAQRRWPADAVIIAVGQRAVLPRLGGAELVAPREAYDGSPWHPAGWPAALFAAGDALSGPSSVAEAIASGRQAATAIHTSLMGTPPPAWEDGDTAIPLWTADWPTHVARARDWRAANETYHAHQRAQGYIEMDRLLAALGLGRPLPAQRRRDVLHTAIEVYLQTDATTAVAQATGDGIELEVSRCPLFDRFDDPAWVGVTACGCFSRIKGWHDALGVPADIELVTNRKWDDPVCQVVLHLPSDGQVDSAHQPPAQIASSDTTVERAGA